MGLNRNLLRCFNERDIRTSEFLEKLRPVEHLEGKEREELQDKIAKEIEATYPYREGKGPKKE